eukprot:scaffold214168_cov30-Tisochrysis_lutea.AAC.1
MNSAGMHGHDHPLPSAPPPSPLYSFALRHMLAAAPCVRDHLRQGSIPLRIAEPPRHCQSVETTPTDQASTSQSPRRQTATGFPRSSAHAARLSRLQSLPSTPRFLPRAVSMCSPSAW